MTMKAVKEAAVKVVVRAWLPVVIVVVWWFASAGSTSLYFPPLAEIVDELRREWLLGPRFFADFLPSLRNFFAGFLVAIVAGTVFGVLLGLLPRLGDYLSPIVTFLRSLPPVSLVPIVLLLFPLGAPMSIAFIVLGAIWPTLLNATDGVRSVDTQVREMVRSYRLSRWQRIRFVVLPNAGPQIFAGYRISLQISIILIVFSEMVGATEGLGFYVLQSQQLFRVTQTWAGTIVLGLLGYALTLGFVMVERRLLRWQSRMRAAMGAA